jgi:DNA replication protein DnaC
LQTKGGIKRVFPGNNTPDGFFSYYDYIIPKNANRVFVIKGGPGVGKSTFMRAIAKDMVERGYNVEMHHCSSDNGSIDGVVFPEIGIGILDGTWPHVVDPKVPGAVDEIVWLGEFWDEKSVRAHKKEILQAQKGAESVFRRAYRFLKAAQIIYEDWESIYMEAMDFGRANMIAEHIIHENFAHIEVAAKPGFQRKLFASAITPDGMVNYLNSIVAGCKKRYVICGHPGTGKSVLLHKVAQAALERGFFVETYFCPLHPHKVEHVVVPELGLALTKSIEPHTYIPCREDRVVDMNCCLDDGIVEKHYPYIVRAQDEFSRLFSSSIYYIGQAKQYHDALEEFYAPNMDFEGIEKLRQTIVGRTLAYAREAESETGQNSGFGYGYGPGL